MGKIKHTLFFALLLSLNANAQRTEKVSGEYTYPVRDNDNITLRDAKIKCIELAKAEAIKNVFGQLITIDVIDNHMNDGESEKSYYWENTVAMAKGRWLGDTEPPSLDIIYKDGQLVFTAKVQGIAREISQVTTDLKWEVQKEGLDGKVAASTFDSGENVYVEFRSPADGYVAVYLMEDDDKTWCLLPYPEDSDGRFPVKANRSYVFFDKNKTTDPSAHQYVLKTKRPQEKNQFIIIYSTKPFTKCNDDSKDKLHPNSLNSHDFQKWLLKCQREDSEMVVNKKWVKIENKQLQ